MSKLVIEGDWSDGACYCFVAWQHCYFESSVERMLRNHYGVGDRDKRLSDIRRGFQELGSDRGKPCPGSFLPTTAVQPAHCGSRDLLWTSPSSERLADD